MARAIAILPAGEKGGAPLRDTLLLGHDERRAPTGVATGLRGTAVTFALPALTRLNHDDRLVLDDGGVVEVVARPEPVLEVRAPDITTLARAAWLLGDHHIPVEIHARYLRVLRTAAVEDLLRTLGVSVRAIEAPFQPEGGAYDHSDTGGA